MKQIFYIVGSAAALYLAYEFILKPYQAKKAIAKAEEAAASATAAGNVSMPSEERHQLFLDAVKAARGIVAANTTLMSAVKINIYEILATDITGMEAKLMADAAQGKDIIFMIFTAVDMIYTQKYGINPHLSLPSSGRTGAYETIGTNRSGIN